jgi:hypothetical protein
MSSPPLYFMPLVTYGIKYREGQTSQLRRKSTFDWCCLVKEEYRTRHGRKGAHALSWVWWAVGFLCLCEFRLRVRVCLCMGVARPPRVLSSNDKSGPCTCVSRHRKVVTTVHPSHNFGFKGLVGLSSNCPCSRHQMGTCSFLGSR